MDSLTFQPGQAHLASTSSVKPWCVVFEDEGPAGYCYACDLSLGEGDQCILDSMLIYNSAALDDRTRDRIASVQWSRNGLQAVLYLDGSPQALVDFSRRESFCRSNFPNFLESQGDSWRKSSHAWDDQAIQRFEAAIYE